MRRADVLAWAAILALGLVAASLGAWLGRRMAAADEPPVAAGVDEVAIGEALPSLRLPPLAGGAERELAGPGRPRLINYWASWCRPCRDEMPALDAYAASQAGNGVEVVGIALDEAGPAQAFLRRVPVRFALLVEPPGLADSSVRLGNRRGLLPYTVLIDADGRLRKRHYGAFDSADEVAAWVAE